MTNEIVFFDIETGGLDMAKHAITQIAAIAVDASTLEIIAEFERKIRFKPESVDPEALKLNSYDPAVWERDAVHPEEACADLSRFLQGFASVRMISQRTGNPYRVAQLAGHNAATFDGPFLKAWYERLNAFMPASYRVLCTLQRVQWLYQERPDLTPPADFKLATLCQHFGICLDGAHDALADCRATIELYKAILNVSPLAIGAST